MTIATVQRKFLTAIVIAVLAIGAFGAFSAPVVRAESGPGEAVSTSNETVISLLKQLVELLQAQLKALQEGAVVTVPKEDEEEDDEDTDCSDDETGLGEVEATVYTNETVIEIEFDGEKDVIVTEADTRDEIIQRIQDEHETLTESEIDEKLELEEEDRESRAADKAVEDEDDDDCASDDDEEDEDDSDDEDDEEEDGDDSDDDEDDDEDEEEDDG